MNYSQLSKHRSELMGMAIIGILFCHFKECLIIHQKNVPIYADLLSRGICGVDIFIVISGIGLYYSFTNDQNILYFYKKRFTRLIPAYLIIGGIYWLINDVVIYHVKFSRFLEDLFLLSFFRRGTSIFWYIPAMIIFYLLFPFLYHYLTNNKILAGISIWGKTFFLIIITAVCDYLLSRVLPIYRHIAIMTGRFPAFIIGTYFGCKSYRKCPCSIGELLLLPAVKIILHFLYRIPVIEQCLEKINVHYLDTILALLVIEAFLLFVNFVDIKVLRSILNWYAIITLEVYLLHMSLLSLFRNPYNAAVYFLVCAVIPSAGGYFIHKVIKSGLKSV